MRYLGIDFGTKRIGLALSDAGARIAFPHSVIHQGGNIFIYDQVLAVLKRERVDSIVIGLPLGMDGSETQESGRVREFARELSAKTSLPIAFENEMFSSRMVEDAGVAKEHVDEASAALVLQSYLDKKK
jgi:putative Holliday junction resolvase